MSEFFNVTLEKDAILDDSSIKNNMTWSSEKILKEIVNKRLTKFEELEDVDVTNKKNKQLVAFSEDTGKFITIDGVEAGEITGTGLKQISKMGVVASANMPKIVEIPINTLDFKVSRTNVLKYDTSNCANILVTRNNFNNVEISDFIEDKFVEFDGTSHLKTEYLYNYNIILDNNIYIESELEINLDDFKAVTSFSNFTDGVIEKMKIDAIPYDRLLVANGDINLSNVEHIDYFKLTAIGKNIRIVCSVDSGVTWKTFKVDKWVDINFNIEDVRTNGMSIELFNSINDVFWNELITTKKVRFAYLFSMNNITDVETLDKLELQYDGKGRWIQSREDKYDVVYTSNSILEIVLKESGDFKINF